jgi:hypothetical protein
VNPNWLSSLTGPFAGTTPQVAVTTGTSALVILSAKIENAFPMGLVNFVITGDTTRSCVASTDCNDTELGSDGNAVISKVHVVTGLNPGTNTFSMVYRTPGTATFSQREITVIPF